MKNKVILLLICFTMIFTNVFAGMEIDTSNGETMYQFFESLLTATRKNYRFEVTEEQMLRSAVKKILIEHPELFDDLAKGAYDSLDPNSRYLKEDEYTKRSETVMGQFVGIGVNVVENNGKIIVASPIKGSPAMEAGLQTGDIIVSVDEKDVTSMTMDAVIDIIRGTEGTYVNVGILRNNNKILFNVKRSLIKVSPIEYENLNKNNSAYVKIESFNANTDQYLTEALNELSKVGVDKIILDLRNNPGGLLSEAVNVVSHFIPEDQVVTVESFKNEKKDITYYSKHTDKKFKIVVLVNDYSASASEIVSGVIKDYKAGPLVGVKTFGKGTVQHATVLKNKGAIWLTIAKYNLPNGENIHEVGIEPDYYINNKKEKVDASKFSELKVDKVLNLGDECKEVLALKERLRVMGYYFNSMDEKFDDRLFDIIKDFQTNEKLFSYGVADITTQLRIIDVAKNSVVEVDKQLEKAKELIFGMK